MAQYIEKNFLFLDRRDFSIPRQKFKNFKIFKEIVWKFMLFMSSGGIFIPQVHALIFCGIKIVRSVFSIGSLGGWKISFINLLFFLTLFLMINLFNYGNSNSCCFILLLKQICLSLLPWRARKLNNNCCCILWKISNY